MTFFVLSRVLLLVCLLSDSNELSTFPVSENGGTPIVAAIENAINVRVFCEVTFNNNPSFTTWQLTTFGEPRFLLTFDINGTGISPNSQNFMANGVPVGNGISRSNLTILTFDSSLDMTLLECGLGNTVMANFILRIIRMFI